jgi:large subunit ribosomal protein L29
VKVRELRDLSLNELRTREHELADEVFRLRLKRASAQLPDPMKLREARRALARVKTLLHERTAATPMQGGGR